MTVMETTPNGTIFGHLAASDKDTGDNAKLKFRFSNFASDEFKTLFSLNETSGKD